MSKNKRNKAVSMDTYIKNIERKGYAVVLSSFQHREKEDIALLVNAMLPSELVQAIANVKHPKHKKSVSQLYLEAFRRADIAPTEEHSYDYQIQVSNGKTYQVQGTISHLGNTLFFDELTEDNKTVSNGEITLSSRDSERMFI